MITVAAEVLIDLVEEGTGRYLAHPGGAGANAAVALARLGVPCSMLARVSGDVLGRRLTANLAGNGVSLRDVLKAAEPTTLAMVSLDSDGRAAYSFYASGTADWQWTTAELPGALAPDVQALHTGSLVLALDPGAQAIEKLLAAERARGQVTISIDPNIRPALAAAHADEVARVERQLALAHVVKASDEDAAWLYPGVPVDDVARTWQRLGPRIVVITLGERGAYALGPDGTGQLRPARPTRIVDTVGAGDAFCAGLLDALNRRGLLGGADTVAGTAAPSHRTPHEALDHLTPGELAGAVDWAILIATLTCERAGADPPTREEARRATAAT